MEVCRRAGQWLHIDAPLLRVQPERLQRPPLAQALGLVDELVAAIVARARVALRVLVGHDGAHGLHDGGRDEVLGGDELQALRAVGQCVIDGVAGRHAAGSMLGQAWSSWHVHAAY